LAASIKSIRNPKKAGTKIRKQTAAPSTFDISSISSMYGEIMFAEVLLKTFDF
jgi:hypothetical protein